MARQPGARQSRPHRARRRRRSRGRLRRSFSVRYHSAFHGARAAAGSARPDDRARPGASGLDILGPVFARRARHRVQLARRSGRSSAALHANTHVPGVTVGVGFDPPTDDRRGRAAVKFGLDGAYRALRGPHRREQGVCRAVRLLSAYQRRGRTAQIDLVLIGTPMMPVPRTPAFGTSGYRQRPRQVRRARWRRSARHVVLLREPLDGDDRGVGPGGPGARQRPL